MVSVIEVVASPRSASEEDKMAPINSVVANTANKQPVISKTVLLSKEFKC